MKKLIALLVAVMMIATMIPVMAISTSADNGEQATPATGDWDVYRFANEYPSEDDEETDEEKVYKPTAGYTYTDEGFAMIGADYTDTTPSTTIQSTNKINLKEGVYLQFRVDDYSYDGGTGADQWICLTLTTDQKVAPGSTAYGGGWLSLIRGNGNGNAAVQPHLTNPKTETFGGSFNGIGAASATIGMDDQGREIYTWEVKYDGANYNIFVNGVEVPGAAQTTALLDKLDENGDFYVGVSAQAGVKNGTAAFTILKFGTSEADATVPTGTDSREPEPNEMTIAPIADPSTVEANKPAILWDPESYNLKAGNNISFTVQGDNTWKAQATDALVFWQFTPKRSVSFDAVDFPIFGIMLRNAWFESGMFWYAAGEVMSPQNDCTLPFSIYDGEFFGEDEEYIFVPVDVSDLWEGRINSVRLDFNLSDETQREFEVCFAGMFRSEDEAYEYAKSYLAAGGIDTGVATEEPTDAPENGGDVTEAPTNESVDAPTEAPTNGGDDAAAQGCASIVGIGAVAILAAAAAAVALKKKD